MADLTYLRRDLYESPVFYALCTSEKAFYREMARLKVPPRQLGDWIPGLKDASTHTLKHEKHGRMAIVCVSPRNFTDRYDGAKLAALLTHEAVHVWQEMREHMGEANPSSEFEAYAIQRISQNLMAAYIDQTQPARKK